MSGGNGGRRHVMHPRRLLQHAFVRFLLIGVLNTIVGLSLIFILLHGLGLGYWWSTAIGNTLASLFSYVMNRRFTFNSQVDHRKGFVKFIAVIIVCYAFSYWVSGELTPWAVHVVNVPLGPSSIDSLAVLVGSGFYTVTNYAGHKYFTFRERSPKRLNDPV